MTPIFSTTYDFLYFILQSLLVLGAIAIVWLFYRYVRSVTMQTRLTAARQMADAAVDSVEDQDRLGELKVTRGTDKGKRKRQLAAEWLQKEMTDDGFKMDMEQAKTWIAAAYQNRVGDTELPIMMKELASQALELTTTLDRQHLIQQPANMDRSLYLAGFAVDWIMSQMAKEGRPVQREQALAYLRGEMIARLQVEASQASIDDRLNELAKESVRFMRDLQARGKIAIRPGDLNARVERDVATAHCVTQVAQEGLEVSTIQIAEAISHAFDEKPEEPNVLLP